MKSYIALVFFAVCTLGTLSAQDSYTIQVASPNGAPSLALATLAEKNPQNYTYVAAETIAAEFAHKRADVIIAPVNAGAKLYGMGKSTYKLAAVVTWGNLYVASQRKNFKLKDLKKNSVTLFGENTINASVALFALQKNKLAPKAVQYLAGAANTQSLLLSDPTAIVLTAEPALTAVRMKNQKITAYAINDLYKKGTGFDGFAQAGLFVRAETIADHPQAVAAFLAQAQEACAQCTTDVSAVAKAAVALQILPNETIAAKAIPHCAVRYVSAREAKTQIETTAQIDIAQFGGALPADDFYYGEN